MYVIRKRIKISPESQFIYLLIIMLCPTSQLIATLYEEHRHRDGFLYIKYAVNLLLITK